MTPFQRRDRRTFRRIAVVALSALGFAAPTVNRVMQQLREAIAQCRELSKQVVPYDAVFSRDPMAPLVDARGRMILSAWRASGPTVQGIIWSEERPLAVVDGELLKPGDVIGPYTLLSIRPNGLVAGRDGQQLFVPLDRGLLDGSSAPAAEESAKPSAIFLPEPVAPPRAPRKQSVTPSRLVFQPAPTS